MSNDDDIDYLQQLAKAFKEKGNDDIADRLLAITKRFDALNNLNTILRHIKESAPAFITFITQLNHASTQKSD